MSLYNISTSQITSYYNISDWDTNVDRYEINNNNFYHITPIVHTSGSHIDILYENLEPAPFSVDRFPVQSLIDSSSLLNKSNQQTVADPLANFTYSYYDKIYLAKYWKPIKN